MLEKGRISARQFTIIVLIYCLGSSVLFAPTIMVAQAKQDLWITGFLGMGGGVLVIYAYRALAEHFPDRTLFQYSEILFGKWLGKLVSLIFLFYFFMLSALLLRDVGDFITTEVLPETPIQFVELLFLLVVIMGVRLGLEVIIHASELFFPWIIGMFLILLVMLTPQLRFENLLPVYENGIRPIIGGAYEFMLFPFLETVVFLVLYPYVKRSAQARNAHVVGALLAGLALIALSVVSVLVLGVDPSSRNMYITYELAKRVNIGNFLERVEAITGTVWLMTIYFKLAICFYASTLGLAQILKLKEYRPIILPLGMILVILTLKIYPNVIYLLVEFPIIWHPLQLFVCLVLPLLMLLLAKFRHRKKASA